jgi:hypothetical protein
MRSKSRPVWRGYEYSERYGGAGRQTCPFRLVMSYAQAMKLFKYCAESGIYILGSGQLRLSPPNTFNDPFEFAVNINYSSVTKEKLKRHMNKQEAFENWYQANRAGQDLEAARKYYDSNRDPIANDFMANLPQNMGREQDNACDKASQIWLVGCFSETPKSILMWSHYSNHHRGMVIEFETDNLHPNLLRESFIIKIKYTKTKPVFQYRFGMAGFEKQFLAMAGHKYLDWQYEQEWRIVVPLATVKGGPFMPFDHNAIRSVRFGQRCPIGLRITAHSLLRQPEFKHVVRYETNLNRREYKLEFNELPRDRA